MLSVKKPYLGIPKQHTGQSDILDSFQTARHRRCFVVMFPPGLCDNQYLKQQRENMWNQPKSDKIDLQKVHSSIQGILNSAQRCQSDHSSNPYQAVGL